MNIVRHAFASNRVLLDLDARDFPGIFHQVVQQLVDDGLVAEEAASEVEQLLQAREDQTSTAIGHAVAVPHAYLPRLEEQVVYFVRLARPINLGAPDGVPTRFLFFLLGPPGAAAQHVATLASIVRLVSDQTFRYEARQADDASQLLAALDNFADGIRSGRRGRRVSPGLAYSRRPAGGLRRDLARRLPHYIQDFRDGLHVKCLGSILFLFFACLAPAVTFGGVMAIETDGQIGAVEMIVASAFCGVMYALVSGQPLIILGGTGPLLVFTAILYQLCGDLQIPFLPTYAWVGLWSAGLLMLLAITDASCLMRFFTRFTNETFAALISIIFIYQAVKSLVLIFEDLDIKRHHDTALLSLLLALGTFYIAMSLSRFRRSSYLRPKIREFLADFGPTIALTAMTIVAIWLHEVYLDVLPAPQTFGTTNGRPWKVDLSAAPVWVRYAALGPALLVTLLVFLDQNITARIVNSPDNRLVKGEAYHLDLAVVGILIACCSWFGLPWLVAATVRSLNHVRSLATTEEVVAARGVTRERIINVQENRLTALCIHLLIGASLLLLPYLKSIPMAVLYGIFLYMGVVSMSGNQFFERLSLWLKDPALYPVTHYIRRVPHWTIHAFTLLQLICLSILWVVKSSAIGILFPLFIALLVPVRVIAGRFFKPEYLAALDAEEDPEEEAMDWAG